MLNRVIHLRRDERGMSFIFVGMGFMSFLAATTLAIDVGMIMTARTQAQTAADSGALAGAIALAYNSSTNFSSNGPAVQSAMNAARSNQVMSQVVSIDPADVTFLQDPATGATTRVQVRVFRNTDRGNPVSTMIGQIFGISTADIQATAIAEAIPANASRCVKPFAIPDKWTEKQTPAWDPTDAFNAAFLGPTFSPDIYKTVNETGYTGYKKTNVGLQLTIQPSSGNVKASQYYALDLPGGNTYQDNIDSCSGTKVQIGDTIAAASVQQLADVQRRQQPDRGGSGRLLGRGQQPGCQHHEPEPAHRHRPGVRPGVLRRRTGRRQPADPHRRPDRLLHSERRRQRRDHRPHRADERSCPGHGAGDDASVSQSRQAGRLIPSALRAQPL